MEEGQTKVADAQIPEELKARLQETLAKLMIEHLKPMYTGQLDIDVTYEGYTEENHIFNVAIKLEDGSHINFHTLQKTCEEKDGIRIWPDLRVYGYDTKIRFTLYLSYSTQGVEEEKK